MNHSHAVATFQHALLSSVPSEMRDKTQEQLQQWLEQRQEFKAEAKGDGVLELKFFDFIGDFWLGTTTDAVSRALEQHGEVTHIVAKINSMGGYLHEGVGIFNVLRSHGAKVTVEVVGAAYSAASLIAMAGDDRHMLPGSTQMIHNALTLCVGHANDMRETADVLEKLSASAAEIYSDVTGLSIKRIQEMMDATTYLNASECVEMGFATRSVKGKAAKGATKNHAQATARGSLVSQTALAAAMKLGGGAASSTTDTMKEDKQMSDETKNYEQAVEAKVKAEAAQNKAQAELAEASAKLAELSSQVEAAKAVQGDLSRVLAAVGATNADEALGSIATAVEARDNLLPEAQAKLDAIEKAQAESEEAELLKGLKSENRISPAQEKNLWPSLSLEGKRSFAKTAPKLSGGEVLQEDLSQSDSDPSTLTHQGKSWNEMKGSERAALKRENIELYNAMRQSAGLD